MPDIWMDVDTALSEVPVNIMPLIDDSDFKAIEDGIAYNAGGISLVWNFTTTGGAFSSVAVTPTTGGAYDWAEHAADKGMYTIEIPATDPGGGSIWNDTEGFGWFTGVCTGVLPWRGPVIGFRAAALNNALIDGGDNLQVDLTHIMNTILTEGGGGRLKAAFVKLFDVASPVLVASDVMVGTDNAATAANLATVAGYIDTEIDAIKSVVDAVQAKTDNLPTDPADDSDIDTQLANIKTEVDKIGTIPALDGGAQTVGAAIAKLADDNNGADYDASTDSLQEIRDRGDASWAGAPEACSGTFTVETADTVFNLTATSGTLSDQDDCYHDMVICFFDNSGSIYETKRITDYVGASTRVTVHEGLTFPGEDGVDTWVIYRAGIAPVGSASITDGDKNDIADKVWDEADADHMAAGTKGLKMHHSGGGRYS